MTASNNGGKETLNLTGVSVLALDSSQLGYSILTSVLRGFGIEKIYGGRTYDDATSLAEFKELHLAIIDLEFDGGRGLEFLRWLRRSAENRNRFVPAVLLLGHSTTTEVALARDSGANIVVAKPFSPAVLLKRILRVSKDERPYVEVGSYVGPDRRFKAKDPEDDTLHRRQDDGTDGSSEDEIALPHQAADAVAPGSQAE